LLKIVVTEICSKTTVKLKDNSNILNTVIFICKRVLNIHNLANSSLNILGSFGIANESPNFNHIICAKQKVWRCFMKLHTVSVAFLFFF
jgi:hypothetical protein